MEKYDRKNYEEMAQMVSSLSNDLYQLSFDLRKYWEENNKPGERPMRICNIAHETLRNMSYTLEAIAGEMLGN